MKEALGFIGICVLVIIAVMLVTTLVYTAAVPLLVIDCNQKTKSMGMEHKYNFFAGCMIEVEKGLWIPFENYRYVGLE